MGEQKWNMHLSEKGKNEQKKFFRLCSRADHDKLIGKEPMTIDDFGRILYLLKVLGLEEYELYVAMRFEEQLAAYAKIQDWLDEEDYSLDDGKYSTEGEQAEQWIREFCMQIPNERTRKKCIERYLD